MHEREGWDELLRRVRAGDQQAAAELVRLYEPEVRRAVHARLTDPRLRRVFDSMDVCQSVLAHFFDQAAHGDLAPQSPAELIKLLVTMARNKLRDQVRRQHAARRDCRRETAGDERFEGVAGGEGSPSRILASRELLRRVQERLSEEDRYLLEERAAGREWADLAAELGGDPNALRMRLRRALDRVTDELSLHDSRLH
jgi:RNA polymerase sigma-70 factor (ECF subfamily)